jgi:rhodanese-related sulfurtransferase
MEVFFLMKFSFSMIKVLFPLTLLGLIGCSMLINTPQYIDPSQVWNMIKVNSQNSDLVIIDVRTESEFIAQHIPRAINLDVKSSSFSRDIESLDRKKTYILYCRSGNRSSTALEIMKEAGFKNVASMNGGIKAWIQSGYRITNSYDE